MTLLGAVLLTLYYIPGLSFSSSSSLNSTCSDVTYSPLLYAPLFSLVLVEVSFILNEGLILALSAQGPIFKKTKTFLFRQKYMPPLIYLRTFLAVAEFFSIIACLVGLYHPLAIDPLQGCPPLQVRLNFARGVVFFQVACYVLFLLKVCVYTDPLGCSTPGLLERLSLLDKSDARESLLLASSNDFSEEGVRHRERIKSISVGNTSATNEVARWRRNKFISLINPDDINNMTKVHNDTINRKKIERKLRTIFCCLGVRGQKSRGVALEDVARGLYTVFSEMNVVLSDVIAGFSLLREYQREKKRRHGGGDLALTKKFRMVGDSGSSSV